MQESKERVAGAGSGHWPWGSLLHYLLATWPACLMQVNACDCVVGKIGYGTMSEVLAHNKPFVFIRRDFFNEVGRVTV